MTRLQPAPDLRSQRRYYSELESPLGTLLLLGDGLALSALYLCGQKRRPEVSAEWRRDDAAFRAARDQLQAYFAGELQHFDLPLAPRGTDFQQRVWAALRKIPYGATRTYGELARTLDLDGAARAVGMANARNPLAIVVPCHRVIGAAGALTGYAGGLDRKRWLLAHEQEHGARAAAPAGPVHPALA